MGVRSIIILINEVKDLKKLDIEAISILSNYESGGLDLMNYERMEYVIKYNNKLYAAINLLVTGLLRDYEEYYKDRLIVFESLKIDSDNQIVGAEYIDI